MPRANRFYRPGYLWQITHRCYQEIRHPKQRYSIIDQETLNAFFRVKRSKRLRQEYSLFMQQELEKTSFRWEVPGNIISTEP